MNTEKYHGKYYKGETHAPLTFTQMEVFFWEYERSFYKTNPTASKKEFDDWLENLITDYLPNKNLSGFETADYQEKAAAEFRFAYEYGLKPKIT